MKPFLQVVIISVLFLLTFETEVVSSINCELYSKGITLIREIVSKTDLTLNFIHVNDVILISPCVEETSPEFFNTEKSIFTHLVPGTTLNNRSKHGENNDFQEGSQSNFLRYTGWRRVNILILQNPEIETIPLNFIQGEHALNFILQIGTAPNLNLLLKHPFNSLKYRVELILIQNGANQSSILFKSACFYCSTNGNPKIVQIPSHPHAILSIDSYFPDFTKNFNGKTLEVIAARPVPAIIRFRLDPKSNSLVPAGGFSLPLLLALKAKLNFSMRIKLENTFGLQLGNGSFTGLIGKVQSSESDLGVGAICGFLERYQAVHFQPPNTYQFLTFITTLPKDRKKWEAIFRSFTSRAWLGLGLTILLGVLPVYVLPLLVNAGGTGSELKNGRRYGGKKGPPIRIISAISNGLTFIICCLLEQSASTSKIRTSAALIIVFITWIYSSIVLGTAYKSVLMSNMVTPSVEVGPETFDDLAKAKKTTIYFHYTGGALAKLFGESKSPTFTQISKRWILEPSLFKCIEQTLKPRAACVSYRDNLGVEANRNFTDHHGNLLVKRTLAKAYHLPLCMFVPKSAVYKESMDELVNRQIATGLTDYYNKNELQVALDQGKAWARQKRREKVGGRSITENDELVVLSLEHFISCFALLGLGCTLALGVFVCGLVSTKVNSREFRKSKKK